MLRLRRKTVKRVLVTLILTYLIFDVRPFLLIPNMLICWRPCGRFANGNISMEISVFPRLCVTGDPIRATIRGKELPVGSHFDRSYDRSGIFPELQFSGTAHGGRPVETLYWTCPITGGLGGGGGAQYSEKKIWLGDYVHFGSPGRYRLNLRYVDGVGLTPPYTRIDYNLGNFSIVYLPENPVSKYLKQIILVALYHKLEFDDREALAAKWLGYQETACALQALADSSRQSADTRRGILRNYDYRTVARVLKGMKPEIGMPILNDYAQAHFMRLLYADAQPSPSKAAVTQNDIAELMQGIVVHLDDANREVFRKFVMRFRERFTDGFWQARIKRHADELQQTTDPDKKARLEDGKAWAVKQFEDDSRHFRLQLINAALLLLDHKSPKATGASPGDSG